MRIPCIGAQIFENCLGNLSKHQFDDVFELSAKLQYRRSALASRSIEIITKTSKILKKTQKSGLKKNGIFRLKQFRFFSVPPGSYGFSGPGNRFYEKIWSLEIDFSATSLRSITKIFTEDQPIAIARGAREYA